MLSALRRLARWLAYAPVDPEGPAARLGAVLGATSGGGDLSDLVDPGDALRLLEAAAANLDVPDPLDYPGAITPDPDLAAGLRLLSIAFEGEGKAASAPPDLSWLVGTLLPVPGPGRVPVIEEVATRQAHGLELADVDYAYMGDKARHRMAFFRRPGGAWTVDLVRTLREVGRLQLALGEVQRTSCTGGSPFEV